LAKYFYEIVWFREKQLRIFEYYVFATEIVEDFSKIFSSTGFLRYHKESTINYIYNRNIYSNVFLSIVTHITVVLESVLKEYYASRFDDFSIIHNFPEDIHRIHLLPKSETAKNLTLDVYNSVESHFRYCIAGFMLCHSSCLQ
jgi:hypothetical protein